MTRARSPLGKSDMFLTEQPFQRSGVTLLAAVLAEAPEFGSGAGIYNPGWAFPYSLANSKLTAHWLADEPLPAAWIRAPGRMQNTFGNESFLDEIAAATATDPFEIRTRHLTDQRGLELLERLRKLAKWEPRGVASARRRRARARTRCVLREYELVRTYVAIVADVTVDRTTGAVKVDRVFVVHDCGQIINPDGLRNQIEGNVVQTVSRTLIEKLTFSRSAVTSLNWGSYPILTFPNVPDVVIDLIDRPNEVPWGAGEPTTSVVPVGDRECGFRRDGRAAAIDAVQARPGVGGIESRKARIAGGNPCRHQTTELKTTSRPPFVERTWHSHGSEDEVLAIAAKGPRGAVLVAGLSVAVLLAIWIAFYFFIFVPRGPCWMSTLPHDVVEESERRWAYVVAGVIGFMFAVIIFSSVHWVAQPPSNVETIDASRLHLAGEFVEENLWHGGSARRIGDCTRHRAAIFVCSALHRRSRQYPGHFPGDQPRRRARISHRRTQM